MIGAGLGHALRWANEGQPLDFSGTIEKEVCFLLWLESVACESGTSGGPLGRECRTKSKRWARVLMSLSNSWI